jgi:hypothetical protein
MYPIQSGLAFLVQQVVYGTGTFDGSPYGRARSSFPLSPGSGDENKVVNVSARLFGAKQNALTLEFYDAGVGARVDYTLVEQLGSAITVTLRRAVSGAPLATSSEVAEAINNTSLSVVASYGGDGNGVVTPMAATAIDNVQLGVDPALRGPNANQYIWAIPVNHSAGLFYFEQDTDVVVKQFEAVFNIPSGGPYTVTVSRVNLDTNFEPRVDEKVPVFVWGQLTASKPDIAFSDAALLLHPYQALIVEVTGGLSGLVRFDVRKTAGYPYA